MQFPNRTLLGGTRIENRHHVQPAKIFDHYVSSDRSFTGKRPKIDLQKTIN